MSIYDSKKGLIISTYEETQEKVKEKFVEHFGKEFDLEEGTPNDFFIKLLSDLLYQQLYLIQHAIHAQNIALAQNRELDYIGSKLNMPRLAEEEDDLYRTRLLKTKDHQSATENSLFMALSQEEWVEDLKIYHAMNSKSNFKILPGYLYIILHMKQEFYQLSETDQQIQWNQFALTLLNVRAAGIATRNHPLIENSGVLNPQFEFPNSLRKHGFTEDVMGLSIQEYFTLTQRIKIHIEFHLRKSPDQNQDPFESYSNEKQEQLIQTLTNEIQTRFNGIGKDISHKILKHILGFYLDFSGWIDTYLIIEQNDSPFSLKNTSYIAYPYDYIDIVNVEIINPLKMKR